jgi:hypothetical protein
MKLLQFIHPVCLTFICDAMTTYTILLSFVFHRNAISFFWSLLMFLSYLLFFCQMTGIGEMLFETDDIYLRAEEEQQQQQQQSNVDIGERHVD